VRPVYKTKNVLPTVANQTIQLPEGGYQSPLLNKCFVLNQKKVWVARFFYPDNPLMESGAKHCYFNTQFSIQDLN
jgi:hypothetical protein